MAAILTLITEIVTGLGMLGFRDLDRALEARPRAIANVTDEHYDRLLEARRDGRFRTAFAVSWANGVEFARAPEGLRGRPPWWIEWKGNHRPPRYEQIPADLRVDHVYLVSCKYGSNILTNSSPANLFDRRLADRHHRGLDWFAEVAPEAYQVFYDACRRALAERLGGAHVELPARVVDLRPEDRRVLKEHLPRRLVPREAYRQFAHAVAEASAARWRRSLSTRARREEMLWRLLRLQSAPYFVLGESAAGEPLRFRVGTPWDFRTRFRLRSFRVEAETARDQPVVGWRAVVADRARGTDREVRGHVEVRWSHGRFAQVPEAKVYLDTPHHEVPGYHRLDAGGDGAQLAFGS
ncbi:MAG TPA: hypothetical protein ENK55_09565 [Actinobacteria bacterium]|nr:hypothetical protein [Actinomycetota bacterium]